MYIEYSWIFKNIPVISNYIYIFTCHVYFNTPDTGSKQLPHRWKCCGNTSAAHVTQDLIMLIKSRYEELLRLPLFPLLPSNGLPEVGSTCSAHPGGKWPMGHHGTMAPTIPTLVEATSMARGIGHTDRRASHKNLQCKRNTTHVKNMLESDHDQQTISGKSANECLSFRMIPSYQIITVKWEWVKTY